MNPFIRDALRGHVPDAFLGECSTLSRPLSLDADERQERHDRLLVVAGKAGGARAIVEAALGMTNGDLLLDAAEEAIRNIADGLNDDALDELTRDAEFQQKKNHREAREDAGLPATGATKPE